MMTPAPRLTAAPTFNNLHGPLTLDIRARLVNVLHDPRTHWEEAHGIILRFDTGGFGLTLWQAVLAVDPTFPRRGRVTNSDGRLIDDWSRFPDQVLVARALRYAAALPAKEAR